jgi:predicted Zn-dependent protease
MTLAKLFKTRYLIITLMTGVSMFFSSCTDADGDFNLFTLEDDKKLGSQVEEEIAANPAEYPILSESAYPEAYGHLRRITNTILNSGKVQYKDEFLWKTYIIHDDDVLNAFCTPGGYIYVYTGLIKYLDQETHLAGVLGHEIAHADKRHSTDAMTRQYGLSVLLDVVFGQDNGALARIALEIKELSYSRKAESESDEFSVIYLYPTEFQGNGAAGFFQKLLDQGGGGGVPEFLSTHPSPDNRVEAINAKWQELGGQTKTDNTSRYNDFKASLP